jgi:nucleoside-diphosphate-sugar epimerase
MANVIIFGCGDIGIGLASRLLNAGHQVWGVRRNVGEIPSAITPIAADLATLEAHQIPTRMDYAVYCAAATDAHAASYARCYVTGLQRAIAAMRDHTLRRWIHVSSTRVFGVDNGNWVDEHVAAEPSDAQGHILLQAERLLGSAPWPTTRLRFGGIYGPGRTRMIRLAQSATTDTLTNDHYTNRIHRDDCTAALAFLLLRNDAPPAVVGCDEQPTRQSTVIHWIRDQLGLSPIVPHSITKPSVTGKRCSSALLRALGYRFQYPSYREGYQTLLTEVAAMRR